MRRLLGAFAILWLAAGFSFVHAQVSTGKVERVDDFRVTVAVMQNGDLRIEEVIIYDFGPNERHGIYRDIPLKYNAGKNDISISNVTVADSNGEPYPFTADNFGGFKRIKIGDPDALVNGVKIYAISYVVAGATQWGQDADRIIWNATGDGWQAMIQKARATVVLPPTASGTITSIACYEGAYGSTESCFTSGANLTATRPLAPNEGLTLSLEFPKGILTQPPPPTPFELFLKSFLIYLPLLLPIAVFAFLFRRWWKNGRDPKGRGTIIAQYEPPADLSPIEMGTLLRGAMKPRHISAQIIYLATRGFLKITPVGDDSGKPDDYILEKLRDTTDQDPLSDRLLMMAFFFSNPSFSGVLDLGSFIFRISSNSKEETFAKMQKEFPPRDSVKLSESKNSFPKWIEKIKGEIFQGLLQKEYYDRDPRKASGVYLMVAFFFFFFSFFLFAFWPFLLVSCITVSAVIIGIFGFIMPKVTPKGALEKENILGFRDYLDIAEKDRLNFHNAPEKTPELFERFLPYALALGVVDAWAKEFEGIYTEQPKWYGGTYAGAFVLSDFGHSLDNFNSVSSQAFAAGSSGSGGGGFSGGGAGGGGGGSW